MAWGAISSGYDHGGSQATLPERTCASILSAALTLSIFFAPLLISVERRVSIVGSLQVFVINSIEGEDAAPDKRQRADETLPAVDPRRTERGQQVPDPRVPDSAEARPGEPDPAPIALADLSPMLNGGEALVSLAPPVLAEMGDAHAPPGERGVPGVGEGGGGGGGGAGRGGRDVARVYTASWAPSMDFAKDHRHYPRRAAKARVEGVAWLKCRVIRDDRVRDCRLLGENPRGYGFGQAALKTAPGLRIQLHDQTGRRVYDEWTVVTSTFSLADLKEG